MQLNTSTIEDIKHKCKALALDINKEDLESAKRKVKDRNALAALSMRYDLQVHAFSLPALALTEAENMAYAMGKELDRAIALERLALSFK